MTSRTPRTSARPEDGRNGETAPLLSRDLPRAEPRNDEEREGVEAILSGEGDRLAGHKLYSSAKAMRLPLKVTAPMIEHSAA